MRWPRARHSIVDIFLPALNLTGCRETLLATQPILASRRLVLRQLAAALMYSSAFVVPSGCWRRRRWRSMARLTLPCCAVYALLLGVQWANGVGRPAVRHAVVEWNARRIGVAVGSGAVAAVLICTLGVTAYGAMAAAAASLVGALIVNGRAIGMALSRPA